MRVRQTSQALRWVVRVQVVDDLGVVQLEATAGHVVYRQSDRFEAVVYGRTPDEDQVLGAFSSRGHARRAIKEAWIRRNRARLAVLS